MKPASWLHQGLSHFTHCKLTPLLHENAPLGIVVFQIRSHPR